MPTQPLWIEALVLALGALAGGGLAALRRRSVRYLWPAAGALVCTALLAQWRLGAVPIYADPCPLCGHGWDIDGRAVAFGIAFAATAVQRAPAAAARAGLRAGLFAAAIAWACFRVGLGFWVS